MARSVGSIEVTVEADTGKLKAQLSKAGRQAGEAAAKEIDDALDDIDASIGVEVKEAALKRAEEQIEESLDDLMASVGIQVDDGDLQATSQHIEQSLDHLLATVGVSPDDVELQETRVRIESTLDGLMATVGISPDDVELQKARVKVLHAFDDVEALVGVDVSEFSLRLARNTIDMSLDDLMASVGVDVDSIDAQIEKEKLEQTMDGATANVEVEVDKASKAAADSLIENNLSELGNKSGKKFSGNFGGHWAKIAALIIASGEDIAVALQGALSAGTAILSSAFQGIGAGAIAAVPLVVALGTALGAGVVGAQGFGDALKEVNKEVAAAAANGQPLNTRLLASSEALRGLAPSATAAAVAFAGIKGQLGDLQTVVQQDLFTGMSDAISDLSTTALPSLEEGLRISAQSVNEFGRSLADIAANTDFAGTIQALDPALDDAFDAASALVGSLEPFLKAAAPAAERLAEMFERGAEALQTWLLTNPDQLGSFLDDGLTSLQRWVDLLQATGGLLGSIFSAGAASGDSFVVSLTNIVERWDAWMEDADNADTIKSFFDSGKEAMKAFEPVLAGIKEAFSQLVDDDAISNFQSLGEAIGQMIPALAQVSALLSDVSIVSAISLIVEALGFLANALNLLPDGMLEFVGIVIVATKAVSLLPAGLLQAGGAMIGFGQASVIAATEAAAAATGVGALSAALKLLVVTNAPLLILAGTVTAVMLAFKLFGDSESDASKRTNELTTALQNNVDAIVSQGDAANNSSIGMQALETTLLETGKGSDKLNEAFKEMNDIAGESVVGVGDAVGIIQSLQGTTDKGASALTGLGQKMGLAADDAAALAEIVANTDDNMKDAEIETSSLGRKMTELADKTGVPREELVRMFGALEEIQDQSENTDLTAMTQELLDVASAGTDAQQEMLRLAQEHAAEIGLAGDAIAIYQAYTTELNKASAAEGDAADEVEGLSSSYILVQDSISDAIAAHEAEAAALKETQKAAFDAYKDELQLADATEQAAIAAAEGLGMTEELATNIVELGNAAQTASEKSDALSNSLDILLGRNIDAGQSFDDFNRFIRETTEDLTVMGDKGETELAKVGSALEAAFGQTEAAQDFRDTMREGVTGIIDFATAATEAGTPASEINARIGEMRASLVGVGEQFGLSTADSQAFIDSLLGTPGLIETVVSTPGLFDALLNASNLNLLYDEAGQPVLKEFRAAGIPESMADVEGFQGVVDTLIGTEGGPTVTAENIDPAVVAAEGVVTAVEAADSATADPSITVSTAPEAQALIDGLKTTLEDIDAMTVTPTFTMPSYSLLKTNISNLQTASDVLDATTVSVTVSTPGLQTAIDKVRELDRVIDSLTTSKTITITTINKSIAESMTGRIAAGPMLTTVGERGYAEAIVPLQLPLNRVDPSVRHFAEMLRGGGGMAQTPSGPGRVVNNYMTITPQSADPAAVATQIINRSATLAHR